MAHLATNVLIYDKLRQSIINYDIRKFTTIVNNNSVIIECVEKELDESLINFIVYLDNLDIKTKILMIKKLLKKCNLELNHLLNCPSHDETLISFINYCFGKNYQKILKILFKKNIISIPKQIIIDSKDNIDKIKDIANLGYYIKCNDLTFIYTDISHEIISFICDPIYYNNIFNIDLHSSTNINYIKFQNSFNIYLQQKIFSILEYKVYNVINDLIMSYYTKINSLTFKKYTMQELCFDSLYENFYDTFYMNKYLEFYNINFVKHAYYNRSKPKSFVMCQYCKKSGRYSIQEFKCYNKHICRKYNFDETKIKYIKKYPYINQENTDLLYDLYTKQYCLIKETKTDNDNELSNLKHLKKNYLNMSKYTNINKFQKYKKIYR